MWKLPEGDLHPATDKSIGPKIYFGHGRVQRHCATGILLSPASALPPGAMRLQEKGRRKVKKEELWHSGRHMYMHSIIEIYK